MYVVSNFELIFPRNDSWRRNVSMRNHLLRLKNSMEFPLNQEDLKYPLLFTMKRKIQWTHDRYCISIDCKLNIWLHRVRFSQWKIERERSIGDLMSHKEPVLFDVDNDSFREYSMDYFLKSNWHLLRISYRFLNKPCLRVEINGKFIASISPMKILPIDRPIEESKSLHG